MPPTSPPPTISVPAGFAKTVIFLKENSAVGQYLFLRGGTSYAHSGACSPGPYEQDSDPCAIPIRHNTSAPPSFHEYPAYSQNDNYLDWEGAEKNQGKYNGTAASGTPLVWSTNDPSAVGYQKYNKYGPNYWMVELMIDCSKTESGWFELKGYLTPSAGWESDVAQIACDGYYGGSPPFQSNNHVARCGAVNVFIWGSGGCIVDQV
ncbi:hypothetical protein OESDEN_00904 [Oesophagostomum dentatum]|uniref:Uncharacterized protein n=1 Tax=Oesophagostomum dentatum TaxID=61180 RepID=A0A0B1TSN5_OESDE|nr:hypothetical protein OESDEN_00904 [Oesophagostomum dentatum]